MDIRLIKSILAGTVDTDSLTEEQLDYVQKTMELMKTNIKIISPEKKEEAVTASPAEEPPKTKRSQLEISKFEDAGGDAGVVKFDSNGQWSLDKAIKPGAPINYAEMNKPKPEAKGPDAHTIDYSSGTPKVSGKEWKTSDTKKITPTSNKAIAKEKIISREVKSGKVIDDRIND